MHLADTRFKENGVEFVSPTNRFYGSSKFAPHGKGMSKRGYSPKEEADALCSAMSGSGYTPAPKNEGCPDVCAYQNCNLGMSYTVQCPDHCFQAAAVVYGDPEAHGILGPYEDTSSICRAAILSGVGTNDDSFYVTFTIVEPVRKYQDPGGGKIEFYKWDKTDDPSYTKYYVKDKCCRGGWPPQLGFENNRHLKFRNSFFNEWQNVRAFTVSGAVTNLCPEGFKFKKGSRKSGDPACVVSARQTYTPVDGCDECVEGLPPPLHPENKHIQAHAMHVVECTRLFCCKYH